jgi:hypothetical protein
MKPHKHAKLIKAWADGAEIEQRNLDDEDTEDWHEFDAFWGDETSHDKWEYRIKPEPKPEPIKKMMYLYFVGTNEQKFWISDEPPETYVYRTISQYIGSVEVSK